MELLRIDPAHEIAGMRLNAWVSLVGIVAGVVWFVALAAARTGPPAAGSRKPARRPEMAVPRGARPTAAARFAPWRRPSAISSWTSTRSRARSTSC